MDFFTKYSSLYRLNNEVSLLINTLTGAKDLIDEPTRAVIEQMIQGRTVNCSSELREQLQKRGYLFDSEEKERELLDQMHEKTKLINAQSTIPYFTICPTMGCNLRCIYCFESNDLHEECNVLSEEQLESILSLVKESYQLSSEKAGEDPSKDEMQDGVENVRDNDQNQQSFLGTLSLFGGEPLLPINRRIIDRVFSFANEWNFSVSIITNGTSIASYTDILKENAHRVTLQITLDGDKDIHDKRRIRADGSGTFDMVCDGVTKALQLGVQVSLRVNVDNDNLHCLPRLKEVFAERHWIDYPNFAPYLSPVECYEESDVSNTLTDADILEYVYENGLYDAGHPVFYSVGPTARMIESFFRNELWKTSYCGATLGLNYIFTPNGNIYPCHTFCGNDQHTIGTFKDGKLSLNEHHNKWKNRDPFEMKNCENCKYLLLCSGGCPARPNADAETCLVRPTYDRIIELYVQNNRDVFLKAIKNSNKEKTKIG